MPRAASPRRYSQAAFRIASESDGLETWREDLRVSAVALEDRDLSRFLNAPQVPAYQKIEAVRQTLGDTVGPLALNLISILAVRNIAHIIGGIVDEYERLLDAHTGIERGEVVSAVPLDEGQQAKVTGLLSGLVDKDVRLSRMVEPQILGGLIARIGDRLIDGSARTRLAEMRKAMG